MGGPRKIPISNMPPEGRGERQRINVIEIRWEKIYISQKHYIILPLKGKGKSI